MFRSILILTPTLMHVYGFWRAASVPCVKRRIPRKILIGAGYADGSSVPRDHGRRTGEFRT